MPGFGFGFGWWAPRPVLTIAALSTWILATGFWNDSGAWDDTASWID